MPSSPSPDPATEHGRRGQVRRYLEKFTTTIRRGSKDITDGSIPSSSTLEHSRDDTMFNFSDIIATEEPPTMHDEPEQSPSTPLTTSSSETFHIDHSSVYQARAQRLHDRYGMNIAGNNRSTFPSTARRVQKSPRMRVHRSCHMCGIDFGHGIHCRACHHRMCSDCPRAPGRRIQEAMAQAREHPFRLHSPSLETLASRVSTSTTGPASPPLLADTELQTLPSATSLAPPRPDDNLVSLIEPDDDAFSFPPALLTRAARQGTNTHLLPTLPRTSRHVPHSLSANDHPIMKAPAGIQRVYRKPRQRVRFTCHECRTPFDSHSKTCAKCAHERCRECRDTPFGKDKAEPDPRLVEAVNQRLAEVGK